MSVILAMDTVSSVCSVSLFQMRGAAAPLERRSSEPKAHARQLAGFCKELLAEADQPLLGIALVAGPGSYTGLRIGASTAKGLCYALGVPVYAVSTLHCLAEGARLLGANGTSSVIMHARKNEIFTSSFDITPAAVSRLTPDKALHVTDGDSVFEPQQIVVSDSQEILDTYISKQTKRSSFLVEHNALFLRGLLENRMEDFRIEDIHSFEPSYLKEFVANKAKKSIFDKLPF